MSRQVVELKNVTKNIRSKTIIDNISFDVYSGEVFGFLGPNGAGKTTTIRMIVGLMKMSSGDIIVNGKSVKTDFEGAVSQVGAIVENPEMYKFMTGYKNLIHYSRMYKGISKEKIDEVVKLVGLEGRIHEKVKTYSLGMRQRLGIAQSLLHDPKVLILDEPTNGLDPAGIREIRDYIRRLARERDMAVIVSSHLLAEMEMMCDRIGIIQNGKLKDVQLIEDFVGAQAQVYKIEVGNPKAVIDKMRQVFTSWEIQIVGGDLLIDCKKEDIPAIIKWCVEQEVPVFGAAVAAKTLEDRFLEVTSDKKGEPAHV
ncbi:bacitracin ABC transporter ATP-binding protein [Jeotgalibacillus malaysiensis]|uniref:Bacitracin ABC transporter ATP-binding protein n=1 Tax=Jeotgalibacillus malaysiensis TaxID=1508404 RepID=A0A0B5ASG1_9BACL|nr:ABC transporter ATP-binding protein [Jeotgalibacillus malaysiensis]AJD91617.1 bacitracin ABC transporter ATP-binding protein [Jeotgalibacillus malaysiensis]